MRQVCGYLTRTLITVPLGHLCPPPSITLLPAFTQNYALRAQVSTQQHRKQGLVPSWGTLCSFSPTTRSTPTLSQRVHITEAQLGSSHLMLEERTPAIQVGES